MWATDHALGQIVNERLSSGGVSFAGSISDDGLVRGVQGDVGVLVAHLWMCACAALFFANVRPQFVDFQGRDLQIAH